MRGDPGVAPDREPLAAFLGRRQADLLARWGARVLADPEIPEAQRRSGPALADHIPVLLQRLIAALSADDGRAAEGDRGEPPPALRELAHFRAAVNEICARERLVMTPLEASVFNAVLDDAMVRAADRLRDAAKRTETELRRLSDSGMLGVIVATRDGRIRDANDAFLRMVGYDRADLAAGRVRWLEMTPPEYLHLDERALAELDATGIARPYEKAYLRRDGTRVPILLGVATVHAADTYVAYVLDIGARKAAEAEVERSRVERDATLAMLDTFMDAAPVGFAVVSAELRYVRINDALARLNGRPASEHIGRTVGEVIPQFADEAEALLRRVLETREPVVGLHLDVVASGETRHLLASYYPLQTADGSLAVGGVVVDVTADKRAERELRRDADLRERFMAVLGHDLRSPLQTVQLSAQTLLRLGCVSPEEQRAAARIVSAAKRMDRLISDLVDVVRVRETGGLPVERSRVNLRDVCAQVIDEIGAAHGGREIALFAHGGCQGCWDPDRIAQLASNLITNAVLYSPPDTPVRVDVGGEDAASVFLRVHNLGPPIPPEVRAEIFEPFRRGHRRDDPGRRAGLGLGLHIANEIARAHGGRIDVESDALDGTAFTVLLPREPPQA